MKELVERVEWQTTKTEQGNIGKHESERNIKVFPFQPGALAGKKRFLEFEVTRNDHMSENAPCRKTVTVMFKDPPGDLVPVAWNSLRSRLCQI